MDPYQSSQTGHELPTSSTHGDMIPAVPGQEAPRSSYEMPMQSGASAASGVPGVAPPMIPPVPQSPAPVAPVTPALTPVNTPTVADDLDLIEKEWVEKAKSIVMKTRNDPYAQNQELNRFKADYMQKRYNKEIKIEP